MATLYMMIGIPGSGKSTYAKAQATKYPNKFKYISRDEIRFSLLNDADDYFAKEKETFQEFCRQIKKYLVNDYNVIADATHISSGSRKKLLKNIQGFYTNLIAVYMDTPLDECLRRNNLRDHNSRSYVPESTIIDMYNHRVFPEKENFDKIIRVIPHEQYLYHV